MSVCSTFVGEKNEVPSIEASKQACTKYADVLIFFRAGDFAQSAGASKSEMQG
jgi:hypothetical protein